MPATLVHLSDSVHPVPTKRHDSLSRSFREALDALEKLLVAGSLLNLCRRIPGRSPRPLDEAWDHMFMSHCALTGYLAGRMRDLEVRLRRTLDSPLSEAQRGDVLTMLYGAKGTRRNPHVLSDSELKLVAQYRELDPADRQMLRTFLARIASSNQGR